MTKKAESLTTAHGEFGVQQSISTRIMSLVQENKEFERFWKFAVVGAIGFVIDAGSVNGLKALGWFRDVTLESPFGGFALTEVGIVGAVGFILAITSNFLWNRFWTYPDSRSKSIISQIITFFAINIIGILIRIPILEGLSSPFANIIGKVIPGLSSISAEWLGINAALALAVIVVMFWNFFVNRYITYNDVD